MLVNEVSVTQSMCANAAEVMNANTTGPGNARTAHDPSHIQGRDQEIKTNHFLEMHPFSLRQTIFFAMWSSSSG